MSTQYNGNPAAVALPAAASIASSTNTNPIVITTVAPHGLTSNDLVDVSGHPTNTTANGIWPATVLTATTFSIPVAGSGVGGATGSVQSLAVGSTFAIPSDGDDDTGASVDAAFNAIGDRTALLAAVTGATKLAGRIVYTTSDLTNGFAWANVTVIAVAATWYQLAYAVSGITQLAELSLSERGPLLPVAPPATSLPVSMTGVQAGDHIHVKLSADPFLSTGPVRFGLWAASVAPGAAAPSFPGGFSQLLGCSQQVTASLQRLSLDGWFVVPTSGTLYIALAVYSLAVTGTNSFSLYGDGVMSVELWRPTGFKQ